MKFLKKKLVFLIFILCFIISTSDSFAINHSATVVDYPIYAASGEKVDMTYSTLNVNSRTYLSIRDIANLLDVRIDWDNQSRSIYVDTSSKAELDFSDRINSIKKGTKIKSKEVSFPIYVDGWRKYPEFLELVIDGRTYLSIRDIANMLEIPIDFAGAKDGGPKVIISEKNYNNYQKDNIEAEVQKEKDQERIKKEIEKQEQERQEEQRKEIEKQEQERQEQEKREKEKENIGNYDFTDEMLSLVNNFRAENGVPPMEKMTDNQSYADTRAVEIAEFFSHDRPSGGSALDYITGSYGWKGENIAAGNKKAEDTFNQWVNSPGHRKNMLNPNFTHMATGMYYNPDTMYSYYWVQVFGGSYK